MLGLLRRSLLGACGVESGSRLIVAVSGGPDSVALLLGLGALAPDLSLALHVAHVDHGLRAESAADAAFVADLASRLGLPYSLERPDVLALARHRRRGVEDAARVARYDALARVAEEVGAAAVAVGHTADDQAETILLHIVRGAGLAGLIGMSYATDLDVETGRSLRVVRPLLGASRADTVPYCRARGVEPRRDETNESADFLRNRVRAEVLPLLRSLNPRVGDALVRLGEAAALDGAQLREDADIAWIAAVRSSEGTIALDRATYARFGPAIRRRLLQRAYRDSAEMGESLTARHVRDADRLILSGSSGQSLDLPGGVRLSVGYGQVGLSSETALSLPASPIDLRVPGVTNLPSVGMRIFAEERETPCAWGRSDRWHADVDLDRCGADLVVRRRRDGDRFVPFGAGSSRKLQDVLVDLKVPREQRDAVPLVARAGAQGEVVWVAGVRLDNRFRVSDDTRRILCLRAEASDRSPSR